jgi:hypothetical protein
MMWTNLINSTVSLALTRGGDPLLAVSFLFDDKKSPIFESQQVISTTPLALTRRGNPLSAVSFLFDDKRFPIFDPSRWYISLPLKKLTQLISQPQLRHQPHYKDQYA